MTPARVLDVETPAGPARARLLAAPTKRTRGTLVLGHGAGGGVDAPDLRTAAAAALDARFHVALVEQPYRVAGRRSPPPASRLDEAWIAVLHRLTDELRARRLVVGGRSSGARVACRTAEAVGASAVLCLAFPLRPPRRSGAVPSRIGELDGVRVPSLVVQGERDAFGIPPAAAGRTVVLVPGDHGLRRDPGAIEAAVGDWLRSL